MRRLRPAARSSRTTASRAAARPPCRSGSSGRRACGVVLDLLQQALLPRSSATTLLRAPRSGPARRSGPAFSFMRAVVVDDVDLRAGCGAGPISKSFGSCAGRHLHRAGAERRVDEVVGDDRDLAVHQRQEHASCRPGRGSARPPGSPPRRCRPAWSPAAWWPPSRRRSPSARPGSGCARGCPSLLLVLHLEVGERGAAARAPVDDVACRGRSALRRRGARRPRAPRASSPSSMVKRSRAQSQDAPKLLQLPQDGAAVLLLPLPDALDELLAAQVVAASVPSSASCRSTTFWVAMPAWSVPGSQSASYPCMRCQRISDVDLGVVERVAHVQRRRSRWAAGSPARTSGVGCWVGAEQAPLHPPLPPAGLDLARIRRLWPTPPA